MTSRLEAAVTEADPADLLPARGSSEGPAPPSRLSLVAADRLADACWVAVLEDQDGARYGAPLVVGASGARRAVPGDGAAEALVAAVLAGQGTSTHLSWTRTGAGVPAAGERAMGVDQTHESVVVGAAAVVKWSVRASASPAPRQLAHLHALGFPDVPTPWGFVEHRGLLVASVDRYLPGAQDGWTWCVEDLAADALRNRPADLTSADELGRLVARLHVALATPSPVIELPVSTAGPTQVRDWHRRAGAALVHAAEVVGGPEGERLRSRAARASAVVDELLGVEATPVIHGHGDLHVGQVLRWDGGMAVTDFDGNPVLPPQERFVPEPAARDVAGMLQSLDHVGRVVTRRVAGASASVVARWIVAAQAAFLSGYRSTLAGHGLSRLLDERLLPAFAVEQECREYAYATSHLPRWLYVPDAAFAALFPEE